CATRTIELVDGKISRDVRTAVR
ncbi:MAG: hypothetical protein QOE54_1208, partial [Streptosporangiaceae bacterium]|nr:hypothetical protein [Streptosporangiaceae bacterium]